MRGPTLEDMKIEIERLSLRELDALVRAAEQRKTLLCARRPAAVVRRERIALAASHGYTIEELIGVGPVAPVVRDAPRRRKRVKLAAKYRDPENKRKPGPVVVECRAGWPRRRSAVSPWWTSSYLDWAAPLRRRAVQSAEDPFSSKDEAFESWSTIRTVTHVRFQPEVDSSC